MGPNNYKKPEYGPDPFGAKFGLFATGFFIQTKVLKKPMFKKKFFKNT